MEPINHPISSSDYFFKLPADVIKHIIFPFFTKCKDTRSLFFVSKKFRQLSLGDKPFLSEKLKKIINLTPLDLGLPRLIEERKRSTSILDFEINALCHFNGKLHFAYPHISKPPVSSTTLCEYDIGSGELKSRALEIYSDVRNIQINEEGILLQKKYYGSTFLPKDTQNRISIELTGGASVETIHSNRNEEGLFAGTRVLSNIITIYDSIGRKLNEFTPIEAGYIFESLQMDKEHVYGVYYKRFSDDPNAYLGVFSLSTGKEILNHPFRFHGTGCTFLVMGNGRLGLASFTHDKSTLYFMDTPSLGNKQSCEINSRIEDMKFHEGKLFATLHDRRVGIWEETNGKLYGFIKGKQTYVRHFDISGDYLALATNKKEVEIWDIRTGLMVHHFPTLSYASSLKFEEDCLLVGTDAGLVQIWKPDLKPTKFEEEPKVEAPKVEEKKQVEIEPKKPQIEKEVVQQKTFWDRVKGVLSFIFYPFIWLKRKLFGGT